MTPAVQGALWIGGLILGAGAIVGCVAVASKPPAQPLTAMPAIAQVVYLTPQNQTVALATSTQLIFQAPVGGTVLSAQGPKGKATHPGVVNYTVNPVNGQIPKGVYTFQYSDPSGSQFGQTYSVTVTIT